VNFKKWLEQQETAEQEKRVKKAKPTKGWPDQYFVGYPSRPYLCPKK